MRARSLAAATSIVGMLVVGACSSGSDSDGAATTTTAKVDTTRPSGSWSTVRWLTGRSDEPSGEGNGVAAELWMELVPKCPSGPCDIEVRPDGVAGTFAPGDLPSSTATGAKPEPYVLKWDAAAGTYSSTSTTRETCTNTDGVVVDDAYDDTISITLTYAPPKGSVPARVSGTRTEKAVATAAGTAKKCTTYDAAFKLVGAPRSAFDADSVTSASGRYVTTETVIKVVNPAGKRDPGFSGLLSPQTVGGAAPSLDITGQLATPAGLTSGAAGWAGGVKDVPTACDGTSGSVDKGATGSESWSDLHVIALTDDGRGVLASGWNLAQSPTPAGSEAGCAAVTNQGRLILVPDSAV